MTGVAASRAVECLATVSNIVRGLLESLYESFVRGSKVSAKRGGTRAFLLV